MGKLVEPINPFFVLRFQPKWLFLVLCWTLGVGLCLVELVNEDNSSGADSGGAFIRQQLIDLRNQGTAILVISEELEELLDDQDNIVPITYILSVLAENNITKPGEEPAWQGFFENNKSYIQVFYDRSFLLREGLSHLYFLQE